MGLGIADLRGAVIAWALGKCKSEAKARRARGGEPALHMHPPRCAELISARLSPNTHLSDAALREAVGHIGRLLQGSHFLIMGHHSPACRRAMARSRRSRHVSRPRMAIVANSGGVTDLPVTALRTMVNNCDGLRFRSSHNRRMSCSSG